METSKRLMSYFDVQKETKAEIMRWIDEKNLEEVKYRDHRSHLLC